MNVIVVYARWCGILLFNLLVVMCAYGNYTYELAVCAIFQNEARFLKEWIEFHRLVGVQHFYLYDNNSTDNYREILEPYIQAGLVDLISWPMSNEKRLTAQRGAYSDNIKKVRGIVCWVAYIDLDEYLFTCSGKSLPEFLRDYKDYGGLCVNWVMFGTSGVQEVPKQALMIEYLTFCDPKGNKHIKSIVRPEAACVFTNPHYPRYEVGFYQVNVDKCRFDGPFSPSILIDKIRINHYWTRDINFLHQVKLPRSSYLNLNKMVLDDDSWYIPRAKGITMSPTEWVLAVAHCINKEQDYVIQQYVEPLYRAMK